MKLEKEVVPLNATSSKTYSCLKDRAILHDIDVLVNFVENASGSQGFIG